MLVTVADLENHMSDVTFSESQRLDATVVLEGLQADLETHLNRPVEPTDLVETVDVDADGDLYLQTPVQSITSVVVDGVALATTSYIKVAPGVNVWGYGVGNQAVVTYTAGFANGSRQQKACRLAILTAASRIMTNRHDDTLSVSDLDTRHPPNPPVEGWLPDELRALDRLRRRTAR